MSSKLILEKNSISLWHELMKRGLGWEIGMQFLYFKDLLSAVIGTAERKKGESKKGRKNDKETRSESEQERTEKDLIEKVFSLGTFHM